MKRKRSNCLSLLFSLCLFISLTSCTTQDEVNWQDYEIFTTVTEVSKFYPDLRYDLSGKYEKARITKYIDGTSDIEYEYDFTDSERYDPLYYSITIEKANSVSDAKAAFTIMKKALITGNKWADMTAEEVTTLDLPGDQNYYAMRYFDGYPNGVLFMTRRGKVNYSLIVSGLYSDDHSLITDLVLPDIVDLETFSIE